MVKSPRKGLWRAASRRVRRHEPDHDSSQPTPDDGEDAEQKLIRVKVASHGLKTVFQPIVDLRTGGTVGAEALSRFTTPPLQPPDIWFAEAADVGLEIELEVAALDLALQQLRRLPSGLYLSVNASPATILSSDFRSVLSDVTAERVVLELTEHTGIEDYDRFREAIRELRAKGLRLAIDDAGAGFSSFRHILNLSPDIIKLDIALTRGIDSDPARKALGSALLSFGLDAYNATIVAEGIETAGEMDTLRALGCNYGQGFYLGKPGDMHRLALRHGPQANVRSLRGELRRELARGGSAERLTLPHSNEANSFAASLALFAEITESLDLKDESRWTGGVLPRRAPSRLRS